MSKAPGPYQALSTELRVGRSVDDPPPYSEVDTTGVIDDNVNVPTPSLPYMPDVGRIIRTRSQAGSTLGSPSILDGVSDTGDVPTTVVTRGVPLASKSIDVVCPHCKVDIRTSIEKRPGLLAYLSGAVMACLCCFCGCCLIPCCIEECMEVKHTCPNCDGLIGKYRL